MKYNLSKIMKRAWELKKITNDIFGLCLKTAWAEAKNAKEVIAISLESFTGTEKQKKYAENLVEGIASTVKLNTAGYHIENGIVRYVDPENADAIKAAYISVKFAISTKKTYGDVIGLLKNTCILDLADDLKHMAHKSHETVFDIANKTISNIRKAMANK